MAQNKAEHNEDELNAPEWLNNAFFADVLRNAENSNNIEVTNLKISPATAKGDHYASVMFRAVVDYRLNGQKKNKSMVLKTIPEIEGKKKEVIQDTHIFETEIGIYAEIIPKIESILKANGDNTKLAPTCLYHALSPRKVIIFEDIVPLGYTVLRGRQPNLEEIKAAYTKIAKWHAISYKLNKEQPELFDKYRYGIFNLDGFIKNELYTDGIKNFIEMLGEHADLAEYKKYFEPFEHNILSYSQAAFSEYRANPQTTAIYGLCHGDFHFKNMMFKHNSQTGNFEDVVLLDYQMSYMGPIVNDLIYSKFMLLNAELRANHWDKLLYHYFKNFQETLIKIAFEGDIPKFIELRQELMRQKNFELYLFTTFLPIWDSFTEATIDADELFFSANTRKPLFRKQKYVNEARALLPKYLYNGYLES